MRLKVSRAGLELLKGFEGLRPEAERLADGRWVIGHGHTQSAREGAHVGAEDAEALLLYDLMPVVEALNAHVEQPLEQHQFDALASFVFNIGVAAFAGSSVLALVNAARLSEAALALGTWRGGEVAGEARVVEQLVRRRSAEQALFLGAEPAALTSAALAPLEDPRAVSGLPDQPPVTASSVGYAAVEPVGAPDAAATPSRIEPPAVEPSVSEQAVGVDQPAPEPERTSAVTAALSMRLYSPYAGVMGPLPTSAALEAQPRMPAEPVGGAVPDSPPEPPPAILDLAATPGAADGGQLFVLTPPTDDGGMPDASWDGTPAAPQAADEDQVSMFDAGWTGGEALATVMVHETPDTPPARRFDWNRSATFGVMGGVGLMAFAGAIVGFRKAAERATEAGFNDTTVISWSLALLGALCVGIAGYNLFQRLGGTED